MLFTDSGTTFTSAIIQVVLQHRKATNYGNMFMHPNGKVVLDLHTSAPVYSNQPNGPFLFSNLPLPSEYICIKTHFGGHCSDCYPGRYMLGPLGWRRRTTTLYASPPSDPCLIIKFPGGDN